jgi:hypothetical protein
MVGTGGTLPPLPLRPRSTREVGVGKVRAHPIFPADAGAPRTISSRQTLVRARASFPRRRSGDRAPRSPRHHAGRRGQQGRSFDRRCPETSFCGPLSPSLKILFSLAPCFARLAPSPNACPTCGPHARRVQPSRTLVGGAWHRPASVEVEFGEGAKNTCGHQLSSHRTTAPSDSDEQPCPVAPLDACLALGATRKWVARRATKVQGRKPRDG